MVINLYIEQRCKHFIFQNDRNGEFAIGLCNLMRDAEQDHEGNYGQYVCPLGTKDCFIIESLGSDSPQIFRNN